MVKRKVSKSKHSSKRIDRKVTNIDYDLVSNEIQAPVQKEEIRPPVIKPTPVPQQSTQENILIKAPVIEPTPIFKDDTGGKKIENQFRFEKESNTVKNIGIVFFIIIGLFWLTVIVLSVNISTGPHVTEKNVTAISYIGDKTSFVALVNITDIRYIENISALGYLRKDIVSGGALNISKTYVVDDYGNKIKVSFRYSNLSNTYDKLFIANKTTRNTFNVSGTYKFSFNEFILDVSSISAQEKKINEVRNIIVQNVTEGPAAGISFNLAVGMKKVITVFK